ncbi:hypothetical protein JQC92_07900 [Shewanella sp. 202IG2-18]|uniref:hypothetical protein n=1 Tax=Parashewanella hymeniacidonis TaxID=2807618 RepID=UPI001961324F|nr:hypothetical protein [Parashewanella hymeniacidonis]MBM7071960.1 hypothetical protein [Parashewanella hymeniacidonis]
MASIINIAETFEQIFAELEYEFGCSYMFYLYEYGDRKITHSSNPNWYDVYVKDKLIDHCPLLRAGHDRFERNHEKSVIVRWNDIYCTSKEETNVVGIRNEFKICHGISFGRSCGNFKEYLGLATDSTNASFPSLLIMNKTIIDSYLQRLRSIANFQRSDNIIPITNLN